MLLLCTPRLIAYELGPDVTYRAFAAVIITLALFLIIWLIATSKRSRRSSRKRRSRGMRMIPRFALAPTS